MNSRLGRQGDYGHRCHGERGRLCGFDRDSLLGDIGGLGGGGLRGRRGTLHGAHNHLGRDGDRFGWGREGRVRLDDFPMHPRRSNSRGGLIGGLDSFNLGGGQGGGLLGGGLGGVGGGLGGLDGGRGLVGGLGRRGSLRGDFDGPEGRASPLLDRGLDVALWDARLGGLVSRDRLGEGRPFGIGGMRLGMGLGGSRSPSLRSLDHLARRPRPYHYQPPYVEDYESLLDEELLADIIEQERQRFEIPGADLYGVPPGYLEELIGIGGLGGRGPRL